MKLHFNFSLDKLLGPSWKTSLAGYLQLFAVTVYQGYEVLNGKQLTQNDLITLLVSGLTAVILRIMEVEGIKVPDSLVPVVEGKAVKAIEDALKPKAVIPVAPPPTPLPAPIAPIVPLPVPPPPVKVVPLATDGHMVTVDPPYSVTGQATMFGLDWNGGIDASDNGEGFFGYQTRVKTLEGVSLPREVLLSTFLKVDDWGKDGITSAWSKYASMLRQWVDGNKPLLTLDSGGHSVTGQPLVDAGPTAGTDNAIDLTYATAHALNTQGKALCTYMILLGGKPMEIRGWDSKTGKVGLA